MSGEDFTVTTPKRLTSSGSFGKTWATRFCTCTWARSRSVPTLKVTVRVMVPFAVLCEDM